MNGIIYIWGKVGEEVIKTPKETQFETIDNIFLSIHQITHQTIEISYDFDR